MNDQAIRKRVLDANRELPELGLVILTWGNVSEIDRENGRMYIKGSGVGYDEMNTDNIAVTDLEGNPLTDIRPSSDTPIHLEIFKAFPDAVSVVHSHSPFATMWAQLGKDIPCLGTTHADYFDGAVPCTRKMTDEEIISDYEKNNGAVIVEMFRERGIDPMRVPGALIYSHGPFTWGKDVRDAVHHSYVLEYIAKMAMFCNISLGGKLEPVQPVLLEKHQGRKYGPGAYYGQAK
jgi:L-ribulose-5-phosphate 4-epimerase